MRFECQKARIVHDFFVLTSGLLPHSPDPCFRYRSVRRQDCCIPRCLDFGSSSWAGFGKWRLRKFKFYVILLSVRLSILTLDSFSWKHVFEVLLSLFSFFECSKHMLCRLRIYSS